MTPPLSLSITPRKSVYLAGEGILIDIEHRTSAELDMNTVELNTDRTEVVITTADDPDHGEVLTGRDHQVLHGIPALQSVGAPFHAPAGATWESYLELANYRGPLPPGKYRLTLRYRAGETPESIVSTNTVAVEVVPSRTISAAHFWMAGADPRDELASVWVVHGPEGGARWLYRVARKHDPGVVTVASEIGRGAPPAAPPLLAHLNDIAPMHFPRYVVWLDGAGAVVQKVHAYGAASNPLTISTGLAASPAPAIVAPPLQRRNDSLALVVRGADPHGRPVAACIDVPAEGPPRWKGLSLPQVHITHSVVVWDAAEAGFDGQIVVGTAPDARGKSQVLVAGLDGGAPREVLSTGERLLDLVVDQGLSRGYAIALSRGADAFHVRAWGLSMESIVAESSVSFASVDLGEAPPDPVGSVIRAGEPSLSLLFMGPDGWVIVHPDGRVVVPFEVAAKDSSPALVSTPMRGVFLLAPAEVAGFVAIPVKP